MSKPDPALNWACSRNQPLQSPTILSRGPMLSGNHETARHTTYLCAKNLERMFACGWIGFWLERMSPKESVQKTTKADPRPMFFFKRAMIAKDAKGIQPWKAYFIEPKLMGC